MHNKQTNSTRSRNTDTSHAHKKQQTDMFTPITKDTQKTIRDKYFINIHVFGFIKPKNDGLIPLSMQYGSIENAIQQVHDDVKTNRRTKHKAAYTTVPLPRWRPHTFKQSQIYTQDKTDQPYSPKSPESPKQSNQADQSDQEDSPPETTNIQNQDLIIFDEPPIRIPTPPTEEQIKIITFKKQA